MSDNIFVTPGTGKEIAADDIGGVLHQRVKMVIGADSVSDGDVSLSNPIPTRGLEQLFSNSYAALAGGGTFSTPTFDAETGRSYITFSIFSITSLTVSFQESTDGANWTQTEIRYVNAGTANHGSMKISGRYGRVLVTNEATPNAGGISNLNIMICNTDVITNSQIAIEDSLGNPIGGVSTGSPSNGLAVANVATQYLFSTVNSTMAQLSASATFTGTPEITYSQPSYTILLVSDQPGTLTLNQYIDAAGTQLVLQEVFTLAANEKFARSNVVNGNYFSLTYQNTGASATTTLKIDTAYGMIPSSTQLNNAPIALREVNGSPISLGQTTMVNSLPVVLASNQSTIATSVASLPLPSGAATEATLLAAKVDLDTLAATVSGGKIQVEAVLDASDIEIGAVEIKDGATDTRTKVKTDGVDNALVVTQNSQPLPTGAATSANQATEIASLSSIDSKTPALVSGRQPVDGSGVTQPVSAASLPLPSGAATAALQTQPGVDIGDVTINNTSGASAVNIQDGGNSITVDGTVTANAGSGTFAISAASLPLPSGAATSANQATEISSLSSIDTKLTGVTVTQGSTTSGQSGQLIQGAVTTNPPAYTTAQTSPASITPAGYLRVIEEKDEGRNQTNFFMALQIVTTNTDTLMSLTGYKSGAAVGATTTPAVVTSGKTYRINSIQLTYVAIATAGSAHFTLRANTGGVVAIGSPAVSSIQIGGPAATAGVSQTTNLTFPDGIEFAAGTGIGLSMVGRGATGTAAAVGYGQAIIFGYEY